MLLLSIVIPVFNGLNRNLERCLDSIAAVSHSRHGQVELICVDDCSDDSVTARWLDGRSDVRVLRTPRNMRQGGARNVGVEAARGKYVTFIDQDDYYHHGALDEVLERLDVYDGDLLVTDNIEETADGSMPEINPKLGFEDCSMMSPAEFIERNGVVYAPWRMFFNRERYLDNCMKFRADTRLEDIDWGIRLLGCVKNMQFMSLTTVHWVRYPDSTTGGIYSTRGIVDDYLEACVIALRDAKTYFPGNRKVEDFIAINFQYALQYLFLSAHSATEKSRMIQTIPNGLSYHPLMRLLLAHPHATAMLMNVGKPLWRMVRLLYRWRVRRRGS